MDPKHVLAYGKDLYFLCFFGKIAKLLRIRFRIKIIMSCKRSIYPAVGIILKRLKKGRESSNFQENAALSKRKDCHEKESRHDHL
jgi:hypothetical protein